MKQFVLKMSSCLAAVALMVTSMNVNATCALWIHQPKLPEGAKKFRKF